MGRILFIRVSAATYDENDVLKTWPSVAAAVWPDGQSSGSPAKLVQVAVPPAEKGVLQLVSGYVEYVRYAELTKEQREVLTPSANSLQKLHSSLDEALGNRDVATASKLTNEIEDALDKAEESVREVVSS